MKLISISQPFFRRMQLHRAFKKAYRGSLMMAASWKTETGLAALLSGGIGMIGILICMQMKTIVFDTDTNEAEVLLKNTQPPPLMTSKITVTQGLAHINVERNTGTLFQLAKRDIPEATSPEQHAEAETPSRSAQLPVKHTRRWQLKIHRPSVSQALMGDAIANAHQQLQSGHISLARQGFLIVLSQDTHSVEAMEGMLLVSRQLKDRQSEEEYLERLRQEIPDYDNVLGNDVASVEGQG